MKKSLITGVTGQNASYLSEFQLYSPYAEIKHYGAVQKNLELKMKYGF